MSDADVHVENVHCKHMTEKALLCRIGKEDMWIPRSQVREESEVLDDLNASEGTLIISHWIASEKGLVEKSEQPQQSKQRSFKFNRGSQ
jgi:hypothetical protein